MKRRLYKKDIPQGGNYTEKRHIWRREIEKKRLYMEKTTWKWNNKKKRLYREGYYIGKVLLRERTIQKKDNIEKRLHGKKTI